jgi:hypothetical protein
MSFVRYRFLGCWMSLFLFLLSSLFALFALVDLQEKFLMVVRQLPDTWRHQHEAFTAGTRSASASPAPTAAEGTGAGSKQHAHSASQDLFPRTPLHLLGQAARGGGGTGGGGAGGEGDEVVLEQDLDSVRRSRFGGRQSLPW